MPKTFEIPLADHGDGYGLNIIANPAAWNGRRAELEGLTSAILEGYRTGCADRALTVDSFVKLLPDKSRDYVRLSWDKVCTLVGKNVGQQDAAGWEQTIALYRGLGLLQADVKPGDILGK